MIKGSTPFVPGPRPNFNRLKSQVPAASPQNGQNEQNAPAPANQSPEELEAQIDALFGPQSQPAPAHSSTTMATTMTNRRTLGDLVPQSVIPPRAGQQVLPLQVPGDNVANNAEARPRALGKASVSWKSVSTVITPASGFIAGYHGSLNPYSGCTFGCQYCYASNFAKDTQAQDTWGQWVQGKDNAAQALRREVAPGALNGKCLYMSTVTDPYQPLEKKAGVTRAILETLLELHPRVKIVVQTRSPLVVRDLDLFQAIEKAGGRVQVNMTLTTDSESVRKLYEPGCPSNQARLKAIVSLHQAGIQCAITMTPLLPVEDISQWIVDLKATGISRYIVQDFHLPKGNSAPGQQAHGGPHRCESPGGDRVALWNGPGPGRGPVCPGLSGLAQRPESRLPQHRRRPHRLPTPLLGG